MNFASTNYYFRLGVSRHASAEEVRRAFRSLARVYHPDVADNKTYAEEIFKRLNEAYEILSDSAKRKTYDLHLTKTTPLAPTANPFTPPARPASPPPQAPRPSPTPPYRSSANPFQVPPKTGAFSNRAQDLPQPAHRADLDIEAVLDVTLEDAVQGATYVVTIQQNDVAHRKQNLHTCRVHVPPCVYEGQRLRLRGLGYVDHPAFCLGDLYLTIRFVRHNQFRVVGSTLYSETALTPWEATLGARIRYPTLDGMADLHIPPGTQPGGYLRLSKQGLPQKDRQRGDLLILIKLRVPQVTSEKERELWRALANQHGSRR